MPDTIPAVGEHRRLPPDAEVDATPGVYRTVGTDGRSVTLLRVTDAEGRREHTGDLLTVEHAELSAFEPAANPDENRSLARVVSSQVGGIVWQFRVFARSLAERPLASALAVGVVVVGVVGQAFVPAPEWVFSAAIFGGSLALAVLGSNLV